MSEALTTIGGTDLGALGGDITPVASRPKSLERNNFAGTEGISARDVKLPRLSIAQGLSPQLTPGNERYIDALKMFDMFNDLTGEVYGKTPLVFVPVRRDVRCIEFIPRSEGGGVLDPDVPVNDARLRWTKSALEVERADIPPKATMFVEFVVLLIRPGRMPEPIVMSIASKNKFNRRASDNLTTFIKIRGAAIYAGMYTVEPTSVSNDKGTFGVPVIKNAGFIPLEMSDGVTPNPAGLALYNYAKQFHESLEGKSIVVDREPGSDDVDDFPTDDAPAPAATATEM